MTHWDYISFGYAAFLAIGGVMGYAKKGSVPSLVAGVGLGAAMAYGAYLTSKDPNNYLLAAVVALAAGGFMGVRFFNTGKVFPAGVTALASLGILGRFGYRAIQG